MAELHVQRKERSLWPWILAAVILLFLLYWFLWRGDDGMNVGTTDVADSAMVGVAPNTGAMTAVAGPAVTQFLGFVDARSSRSANMAHDYTADGLRQLATALGEIAAGDSVGGVAVQPRVDEIKERADAMQRNPNATQHALQTREAFILASSLIAQMNGNAGSAGAANLSALQNAATAIEPSTALLDQADRIEQFFMLAGEAIRNTTTGASM